MHDLFLKMNIIVLCVFFCAFWKDVPGLEIRNQTISKEVMKISFLSNVRRGNGKFYGGAFYQALHDINNNDDLLPGYKLETLFADTNNDILGTIHSMTDHYINGTVGFIGPDGICGSQTIVATAWNLPMISYGCHDSEMSRQKIIHRMQSTFIQTQPSTSKVSKSIIALLKHFKWSKVTFIVGTSSVWNQTARSIWDMTSHHGIDVVQTRYFKEPYPSNAKFSSILENTLHRTRVYVFLGDFFALIDFVREVHKNPITNTGEYIVIAADERPYNSDIRHYFLKLPYEMELTREDIEAFRSVLLIVPRAPNSATWNTFMENVRKFNHRDPINLPTLPNEYRNVTQLVPIHAAYLYDAVTVFATAMTKLMRQGRPIKNGTAMVEKIRSSTFRSIQGYDVFIDDAGDAEGNYSVLSLSKEMTLDSVASFTMTSGGLGYPTVNIIKEIEWVGGEVPVDEPACGFDGEKCQYEPDWRTATICSVIGAALVVVLVFSVRHYLYEQKLARLLWKIEYKDLQEPGNEDFIQPQRPKRSKSHSPWRFLISTNEPERSSLLGTPKSERPGDEITSSIKKGHYKGTMVAIKHVYKKNIDINRTLKKQLQLRKELTHDNVNRFIGACLDPPHLHIVTQYCARGSLSDILKNKDLHLDDMFVASLVSDLVKGMGFIHDSEIAWHGNLKSSNCLVDSRWVLQVSDFGLHSLVGKDASDKPRDEKYYDDRVWRAPELLRDPTGNKYGTPEADVYSFSLVMYETLGRKGPWGKSGLSSREIVQEVRAGTLTKNFRPDVTVLTCDEYIRQCLTDCWAENPDCRPKFNHIKCRLKPLQNGLKSNIFDNMLAIMEKYAKNLEALVEERTEQLSEEKQMTENLLFRMLPRSVANQLKRGCLVAPEHYDCVSIYFSDIVGFTALSAESTPMQVIDMLNNLYTCFDQIISHYDVYKVETIGDAYMVVSGLPLRNGDNHAGEIASMSLHLLKAIKSFRIVHRPDDTLKLRIGIHSGPCVAGVVGLRMPRYTLFGDTVNTASRMETTGVPLKIHCSMETRNILLKLGGYVLLERGFVAMKGKGEQFTYFLEDENIFARTQRLSKTSLNRSISHELSNGFLGYDISPNCDSYSIPSFQDGCINNDHNCDKLREYSMKYLTSSDYDSKKHSISSMFENGNVKSEMLNGKRPSLQTSFSLECDMCSFRNNPETVPLTLVTDYSQGYIGPEEVLAEENV